MTYGSSCLVALLAVVALLPTVAACDSTPSGPPATSHGPTLLSESELWTKPPGAPFGASACTRRSLPGCEAFPEPVLVASATDGQRLAALTIRDRLAEVPVWDLMVSDDLGETVRRFAMPALVGNGREAYLHMFHGRIFVLTSLTDPLLNTSGSARVFEVDPTQGTVVPSGGSATMSAVSGATLPDGALVTVSFGRASPPQVISVTRFDPATNTIVRDDLDCTVAGCDPRGLQAPFLSSDSEVFTSLVSPAAGPAQSCVMTVHTSTKTLTSECFPELPADNVVPISSFGGTPFDFQLVSADGVAASWLVPVAQHWIPAGPRVVFPSNQARWIGGSFIALSASGFGADGDAALLRLRSGGGLEKTDLQSGGCLNIRANRSADCATVLAIHPLAGDELLVITQRDEFHQEEDRSRQLFEVRRVAGHFESFRP